MTSDADAGRTFPVLPTPDDVRRAIAMIDPLDLHAPTNVDAKCIAPGCGVKCWPHRFFCKQHRDLVPPAAVTKAAEVTRAALALVLAYEAYREEMCNEAAFMPEEKIPRDETGEITHGVPISSGALDALWERVEAARLNLMELSP